MKDYEDIWDPISQGFRRVQVDRKPARSILKAGQVRNLLFHCYPISNWQWHFEQLRKRIGLFNGKRVISLAIDKCNESLISEVTSSAVDIFDEVHRFENNPKLREVVTFEHLFGRVESENENEATLYAHSKGTSRTSRQIRRWCGVLYTTLVDHWPVVQEILQKYPLAGSFKKVGIGWPVQESHSQWHYSGSWFWFRNVDLFSKNWKLIEQFAHGIETYPSLHFREDEAGCVFWQGIIQDTDLFNAETWSRIEPALKEWERVHAM